MRAGLGQRRGGRKPDAAPAPVTSARLPSRRKEGVVGSSTVM